MDALGNTTNSLTPKTNAIIHVHVTGKNIHLHVQLVFNYVMHNANTCKCIATDSPINSCISHK